MVRVMAWVVLPTPYGQSAVVQSAVVRIIFGFGFFIVLRVWLSLVLVFILVGGFCVFGFFFPFRLVFNFPVGRGRWLVLYLRRLVRLRLCLISVIDRLRIVGPICTFVIIGRWA